MTISGHKEWIEKGYHFYDNIRPYYCKHCGSRFEDWDTFTFHLNYHKHKIAMQIRANLDKGYSEKTKDSITKERLRDNTDYQLLLDSYEENKRRKPFICTICGKAFRSKRSGLRPHLKRMHNITIPIKQTKHTIKP